MAIVIIRQDGKIDEWKQKLLEADPSLEIYSYLEEHPAEKISMVLVWKHPRGILANYPNLKCLASFGAGVDFIFEDNTIDPSIPITRVIDPFLASDMSEFVIAQILNYLKNLHQYDSDKSQGVWQPLPYRRLKDTTVGILGMGELGQALARDLVALGTQVVGWASKAREFEGLKVYGSKELTTFLGQSEILVCLLPLTPSTEGILSRQLFAELPKGAYVINVARGGHLVDEDLLKMIDNGHLSGACLDVYHREPLEKEHPFWQHPKVHMTPHIASVSDIASVVPQLLENYSRLLSGEPLKNEVSREKGY
ncbi:2-hydroxyacid dehydrogenase [Poritiphilus flavus]|uniref:Glyoxylate/hydroxypyruvate reductase A n=1 Tax=Poritiphilus flavus TaxID=2697053 RepID=A0A6L9EF52_9FLAO|nr:glyoxylate/hydroxypyruvate reductase A [Poritiphilus flavus]NAS13202.1 glyoxylate/hydroxypyruvate reductase A [Poritiphilus flavus]